MTRGVRSRASRAGIVAISVGALALTVYLLGEVVSEATRTESRTVSPTPTRPEPEKTALPQEATSLQALWELAWKAATDWRTDARLIRMYAAAVHPDGVINRATSDVQFLFLSRGLTQLGAGEGSRNGLRWSLAQGKTFVVEITQYPAPPLDGPEARLCDFRTLTGNTPPAEVVMDASYVEREGNAPVLQIYTSMRQFLVTADPFTCSELSRASARMDDEQGGRDDGGAGESGKPFDSLKADAQLNTALAGLGSCKRSEGPNGPGTVAVRFNQQGKVEDVMFQAGPYRDTAVGRCIEDQLRNVHVKPWNTGRGLVVKRFAL